MHRPETWLEPALTRSLARVEAPRELLDRVLDPADPEPDCSRAWRLWAPAAALLILVIALALSLRAGSQEPRHLAFRSSDPAQIRAWIQKTAALDIPLPAQPAVQLLGANAEGPMAEIAYRIENQDAVLLVSKASSGSPDGPHHHFLPGEHSWVMRGQLYTLAFVNTADFESACRLCHLN